MDYSTWRRLKMEQDCIMSTNNIRTRKQWNKIVCNLVHKYGLKCLYACLPFFMDRRVVGDPDYCYGCQYTRCDYDENGRIEAIHIDILEYGFDTSDMNKHDAEWIDKYKHLILHYV